MITVYYKNTDGCVIRPTPLVTISTSTNRNGLATLGTEYTITLNGTLISHEGSPVYTSNGDQAFGPDGKYNQIGPSWDDAAGASYPNSEIVPYGQKLGSILEKQNAIRELFATDGQRVEFQSIDENGAKIVCFPSVESISFQEGIWVDTCKFTVTLTASSLLDANGNLFEDSSFSADAITHQEGYTGYESSERISELDYLDKYGGFVSSFEDNWTVEPDESVNMTDDQGNVIPLSYRISRSMSATGITKYISDFSGEGDGNAAPVERYNAWRQAKGFIKKKLARGSGVAGANDYPEYDIIAEYASGFIDLAGYTGYSHSRVESIDQTQGTYSITDSWLLASGTTAFEQFTGSVTSATNTAYVEVSLDGNILGASQQPAKDQVKPNTGETAYDRALQKYYEISNNGQYGVGSDVYKRANGMCEQVLNSQPKSISLATNEFTGEITYNVVFDNRPTNIFTNVMSESISVNDTYPGDVFAVIPVIGRATGPVLQYVDTRTEYRRDLSIEIQLDYTDIGYGGDRANLMLTKPSINEPIKTELQTLINQMSPANEPGIRKYFVSAPTESWNPKDGQYSVNISWTYELDK